MGSIQLACQPTKSINQSIKCVDMLICMSNLLCFTVCCRHSPLKVQHTKSFCLWRFFVLATRSCIRHYIETPVYMQWIEEKAKVCVCLQSLSLCVVAIRTFDKSFIKRAFYSCLGWRRIISLEIETRYRHGDALCVCWLILITREWRLLLLPYMGRDSLSVVC